jgi:hypothetical protein
VGIVGIPVDFLPRQSKNPGSGAYKKESAIAAADRIPGEVIQQS